MPQKHDSKSRYHNRQAYIDASLDVIAEVGVEKLSLRKVASRLGVTAMAMYKHFDNKGALITAALDEFIARAEVLPRSALPWQQWVEHVAQGMFEALCGEIAWVAALGSVNIGPQAMAVTDAFIQRLTEEGFSRDEAMEAYFTVIHIVIGAVSMQSSLDRFQSTAMLPGESINEQYRTIATKRQLDISLPLVIEALGQRHG